MRRQYHFRPSSNGYFAWDVHRLVELASCLPVRLIDIDEIDELDQSYWFDPGGAPTCRAIAEHFKLMQAADLSHPIILCAEGRVMDGMHRVTRALVEGHSRIRCVQFSATPSPDFRNVRPEDLPYK